MSREVHVQFCESLGVRFPGATHLVLGFQHQSEADRFLNDMRDRLRKFGLELNDEKTRRIEFGKYAEQRRRQRGEGKPETFDFLGFTHISGKSRHGAFLVRRKTIRKRMRAKLQQLKQQIRERRHAPIAETGRWLRAVVQGHYNYYGVPGNTDRLGSFRHRVLVMWWYALRSRSQNNCMSWHRMLQLAHRWLPPPRAMHPYPDRRFIANIQDKSRMR